MTSHKYIQINSSDRTDGSATNFRVEIPYGIRIKEASLLSVLIPDVITSLILPQFLNITISSLENGVISSNTNVSTFCVPYVPNELLFFTTDMYPQIMEIPNGVYVQQFYVALTDRDGLPVTFSSGNWSLLLEVKY